MKNGADNSTKPTAETPEGQWVKATRKESQFKTNQAPAAEKKGTGIKSLLEKSKSQNVHSK